MSINPLSSYTALAPTARITGTLSTPTPESVREINPNTTSTNLPQVPLQHGSATQSIQFETPQAQMELLQQQYERLKAEVKANPSQSASINPQLREIEKQFAQLALSQTTRDSLTSSQGLSRFMASLEELSPEIAAQFRHADGQRIDLNGCDPTQGANGPLIAILQAHSQEKNAHQQLNVLSCFLQQTLPAARNRGQENVTLTPEQAEALQKSGLALRGTELVSLQNPEQVIDAAILGRLTRSMADSSRTNGLGAVNSRVALSHAGIDMLLNQLEELNHKTEVLNVDMRQTSADMQRTNETLSEQTNQLSVFRNEEVELNQEIEDTQRDQALLERAAQLPEGSQWEQHFNPAEQQRLNGLMNREGVKRNASGEFQWQGGRGNFRAMAGFLHRRQTPILNALTERMTRLREQMTQLQGRIDETLAHATHLRTRYDEQRQQLASYQAEGEQLQTLLAGQQDNMNPDQRNRYQALSTRQRELEAESAAILEEGNRHYQALQNTCLQLSGLHTIAPQAKNQLSESVSNTDPSGQGDFWQEALSIAPSPSDSSELALWAEETQQAIAEGRREYQALLESRATARQISESFARPLQERLQRAQREHAKALEQLSDERKEQLQAFLAQIHTLVQ